MENAVDKDLKATKFAFFLFMLYMVSFFIRLPARLPILGAIRFDLLLVAAIFCLIISSKVKVQDTSKISRYIIFLFSAAIVAIPFASWPGTVLGTGIPALIKASIFFYFTFKLVLSEKRLKIVIYLFLFSNTFRVLEPFVLNQLFGYWGSQTSFGWDQVNRLSGGPYDVINANGLAFVIACILPFYHYLFGGGTFKRKLIYWALTPIFLYTMTLTLSRSGLLAVGIIYAVIFLKSNQKFVMAALGTLVLIVGFSTLNDVQRDRYLSIFSSDTKSSASAEGRLSGLGRDLDVAMLKPILGHGLGTSREANWNFGGNDQPSHNLWLEVFQELGVVGLVIFFLYTKEIYKGFKKTSRIIQLSPNASPFMKTCLPAMQVWLVMNILFSFASYGLTSYEWYLFGGFSAVMARLATKVDESKSEGLRQK